MLWVLGESKALNCELLGKKLNSRGDDFPFGADPIRNLLCRALLTEQSLLTLLISNNFAEIKGSVFKKFDKQNLFQLSCHDVVERFKLVLFLAMIVVLNVCQGGVDDPLSQVSETFLGVGAFLGVG